MERFVNPVGGVALEQVCRAQKVRKGGGGAGCSATRTRGNAKVTTGREGVRGVVCAGRACTVGAVAGRERGRWEPKEPDEESKEGQKEKHKGGISLPLLSRTRNGPPFAGP